MRKFDSPTIGIDHGETVLFQHFENGGEMWTGHGQREVRQPVAFSEPFDAAPVVSVSVSMWDVSNDAFQRGELKAEGVTPQGFDLVFRTWGDSRVARIRASWTAIGPVSAEDIWDI